MMNKKGTTEMRARGAIAGHLGDQVISEFSGPTRGDGGLNRAVRGAISCRSFNITFVTVFPSTAVHPSPLLSSIYLCALVHCYYFIILI